jgi:PAS domain S-box-containing protein
MNLFTRFPIRLTIPLFLLLLALLAEGYTMKYNQRLADAEEEKEALALVTQDMTQLQGSINDRLRKGDWEGVQSAIASRGSNPNILVLVLVDDAGTIIGSTSLKLVGVPLSQALPDTDPILLKEVRTTLTGRVSLSDDQRLVTACYPVILGARVGEIRPHRVGILHLRYDLTFAKSIRSHGLERQALVMAGFYGGCFLLLGIFLHMVFARRAYRLIFTAKHFADGDLSARTGFEGKDELAHIGGAFDRMAEEITWSQEALHRLNRELRAISNCNQVLVRAENEQALLNDICRIICDEAGYRMACVGYAENDDAKTIRPIAWAGTETGYLEQAKLTWADTEWGHGPAGMAIRSGESACIQDFTVSPLVAPWREDALQRGYRSCICLPLKNEDAKTFGVLAIYSTLPNAFTPEEIRLMKELADDLAFGIVVLRARTERKLAADTLKISEEQYRTLIEQASDGIFVANNEGQYIDVNSAGCRLLGYSREEILRLKMRDVTKILPETPFRLDELREGKTFLSEREMIRKDGSLVLVEISAKQLPDGRLQGIVRDITERKRAEDERRGHLRFFESMDRVNRAIQGAHDLDTMMSDVLDIVLSTFDCDRAYLLYPCDPEAASWRVPKERTRPEYPGVLALGLEVPMGDDVARTLRILLDADGPVQFGPGTSYPLPADASERFGFKCFMAMSIRPKVGKPWQFGIHQCSYARIWTTEEEKLLQEIGRRLSDGLSSLLSYRDMRESEQKYREIFDNATDSIFVFDVTTDGRFRFTGVNATSTKLSGVSDSAASGKFLEEVVRPEQVARALPHFRRCVETGELLLYEEQYPRPAGGHSYLFTTLIPVRETNGSICRLIVVTHDITERKRAEEVLHEKAVELETEIAERQRAQEEISKLNESLEQRVHDRTFELEQANVRLKELDKLKSMFIASMSHELRTPLNSVIGFSSILLNEWAGPVPANQKENLAIILTSGKHLLSLINDVIDVSKIEAGMIEPVAEDFDVYDVVSEAATIFAPDVEKKGIALNVQAIHQSLRTDRRRLLQCLLNLISNAVKFTEKGSVSVRVCKTPDTDFVEISVEDTGIGIKEADMQKLFSAFARLDSPLQSTVLGTGLGLYLTKKLLKEVLNGDITVNSSYGKGSRFTLHVPVTGLRRT